MVHVNVRDSRPRALITSGDLSAGRYSDSDAMLRLWAAPADESVSHDRHDAAVRPYNISAHSLLLLVSCRTKDLTSETEDVWPSQCLQYS